VSYILDALRKADRDRALPHVPTLGTAHASAPLSSGRRWVWIVAAALGANLAVIAVVVKLLTGGAHDGRPSPAVAAPVSTAAAAPVTSTVQAVAGDPTPAAQAATPPSGAPAVETRARRDAASAAAHAGRRPAQGRDETAPVPRRSRAAEDADQPVGAAALTRADRGGSRASRGAVTPDGSADLKLEVLVYAADPAARSAWINGRRYVEGQQVLDRFTLEQITPDTVVLAADGRQVILRQ
jgi:general secretion pathway protein B